ncbi:MAG: hypothetical protein Q9215_003047 [Flavoplaca cf. flavocitrina]
MSEHLHSSASPSIASSEGHVQLTYAPAGDSQQNPRKRKRPASQCSGTQRRLSHLKGSYNTKYHGLYNKTVGDLHLDSPTSVMADASSTQGGICLWSPHEKSLLFDGITRYGQDNLPIIAALIGTKSGLEVHAYVQSLKTASVKQHMYGKKQSLVGMADIPAAAELSEECCSSLEQAAESLATLHQRHEERSERQKHSDFCKLDEDIAHWVERRLGESEEGRSEVHEKLPAAELLNLGQLLKLSRNFFMNAQDLDSNWRSFSFRTETPALLYTAFSDLHDIVVSIATRLLQTTLFLAMSRLRAAKSPYYPHQRAVKRCDVLAATKILGMKRDTRDGWIRLARRCKLEAYDHAGGSDTDCIMDHSEVERVLGEKESVPETRAKLDGSTCDDTESNGDSFSEDESVSLTGTFSDPHGPSIQSNTAMDRNEPVDKFGKKTDAYLDSIDQQTSRKEEARLWKMLGKAPHSILASEEPTPTENPGPLRHGRSDLDNWRQWVDLKPEWATYDVHDLAASFRND